MDSFAFIIHPIDPKRDVSRKFPLLGKVLTEGQINFFSTFFPPVYLSEIEGITSEATGKQVRGWLIACPYTPQRMMELPVQTVYRKIIQTGHMAEKLGAQILGTWCIYIGCRRCRGDHCQGAGCASDDRRCIYGFDCCAGISGRRQI